MKNNQIKAGMVLSYAQMLIGIVVGLAYTPVMIRLLGQSEYGLYNTVYSTISMLTVLSLGFNSGYIRYFAKYKSQNNEQAIYKLNGLFLVIFSIIGAVAFVCGMILSYRLDLVFDTGLTAQEYEIAKVLMQLLAVNLAVSFPMSVFQNIISSYEKFVFLKLLGIGKTVVGPCVTLLLLFMGYRSIAMVTVTLAVSIATDLCFFYYVIFVLKNKFFFKGFEKGIFKSLFVYTSFIAINMIVDQINTNMGKFLLGRYQGTIAVAIYSVGYTLYSYYIMFSTSISGVFTPRIHRIINEIEIKNRRKTLTDLFIKVGRIQFLVMALISTGLIFFGKPFVVFWAGAGYDESYYVAVLLILSGSIPLMQNVGIEVQRALNKHQFRSILYIFMAIGNLVATVFLCQKFGAVGAAIGTAISLVVANGLVMNIYYHKKCYIDIIAFWKNILKMSLGLIVPVVAGILLNSFVVFDSVLKLLGGAVTYTGIYAVSMWFIAINPEERKTIMMPIRKVLKR